MYIQSETQIEVRYYETDLMGIVHHSNYIRYFECGRHQFLLDVGLPITELEKSGIMMPGPGWETSSGWSPGWRRSLWPGWRSGPTSTTRTAIWSATAQWSSASSTATPAVPPASPPRCLRSSGRPIRKRRQTIC